MDGVVIICERTTTHAVSLPYALVATTLTVSVPSSKPYVRRRLPVVVVSVLSSSVECQV